jgi:predicted ATP-binding protein involved in virulence
MKIKKIKITGLYGYINKTIDFFEDENYLVGINGSGKSTVIKIIEAFLKKDISFFEELNYQMIKIDTDNNEYTLQIWTSDVEKKFGIYDLNFSTNHKQKIVKDLENIIKDKGQDNLELKNEMEEKIKTIKKTNYIITKLDKDYLDFGLMEYQILNLKTPNLDLDLIEKFSKENRGIDAIEGLLAEINPIRTINNILKDTGKKYLQVFRLETEIKEMNDAEEIEKLKNRFGSNIVTLKKIETFIKITNDFLKDSYKKIEFDPLEGEFKLYSIKRDQTVNKKITDLNLLSSGEKHLLVLLTPIFFTLKENSILLIDEPEESLHVEWQKKIIPALKKAIPEKVQIIVATHSPNLIGEVLITKLIPLYPYNLESEE